MERENYIAKLNEVYKKYYCGENGNCKYFSECRKDINDSPCKFLFDKANIGSKYGNDSSVPKIVFVGLEGLGKRGVVENIEHPSNRAYNPHYKGVRYVLSYIISKISGINPPEHPIKDHLIKYNCTIDMYTLLNCYKCAFSNRAQSLPHTEQMKENCQKILLDEIKTLEPDFLVLQLKKNLPMNFENNILNIYGKQYEHLITAADGHTRAYKLMRSNNNPVILIWTYHGSSDPKQGTRSWTNDTKNNYEYTKSILNPVLDKAIKEYKNSVQQVKNYP